MIRIKELLRHWAYKHPVYFDQIWQIYKILRSRLAGVSYPRYFERNPDFLTAKNNLPGNANTDKSSVLVFMHWFETGGAESFALETIKLLNQKGHNVITIATVPSAHSKTDWFRPYCKEILDLNEKAPIDQWYQFVSDLIIQHSVGYIYIHHSSYAYSIVEKLKTSFPKIRIVDSTHIIEGFNGGFVHMSAKHSPWINNHHVITPSLGAYFINRFGISKNKISYFPLSYMSRELGTTRSPYDQSDTKIKIVFLGRLAQQKRPYYFIELARQLGPLIQARGLVPQFEIYGDGPMKDSLKTQMDRHRIEHLNLHGEVQSKEEVFKNAYALVLPSENEGMPLVFFEATRYGVFSFATDTGQTKDFLSEDFLVPSLNPMKIVEKIILSLDERDRYLQLFYEQKEKLKKLDAIYDNGRAFESFFYGFQK